MEEHTCSVPACGGPIKVRGLCRPHYNRLMYAGTTDPPTLFVEGAPCKFCGGEMPNRRPNGNVRKYCTPQCRKDAGSAKASEFYSANADAIRATAIAKRIARRSSLNRKCLRCHGSIPPTSTMAAKYCSRPCARAATKDTWSRECSELDCVRPVRAKGICSMHYKRAGRVSGQIADDPWNERRRANYEKRRALKHGASSAEVFTNTSIFERDNWTCGICSAPVDGSIPWPDPMSVSLDHVIPVSLGGEHSPSNTQCAHLFCNLSKGNRIAA